MSNDEIGLFGELVGALSGGKSLFPGADADDLQNGARRIPDEVTDARRAGQTVQFVRQGAPEEWYWQLPDGSRIQHKV